MASQVSANRTGGTPMAASTPDLKARIVEAATALFAQRGWQGTHVRDVAREAGCTKPALYYHFDSKETLFLACVHRQVARLREQHRVAHAAGTARERLVAAIAFIGAYASDDTHGLSLLFRASRRPDELQPIYDYGESRATEVDLMREAIDHGIATGEIRSDVDAALASEIITSTVELRLIRFFDTGEPLTARHAEAIVDTLYRGFAS